MEERFQDNTCQNFSCPNYSENSFFAVELVEWVSEGVAKITFSENSSFYVRFCYCETVGSERIAPGACLEQEDFQDLVQAGECFAAEQSAIRYLARCEQNERRLYAKLVNKKITANAAKKALQYLKEKSYLSDERYARAWLHNRLITQFEGKGRLEAGLLSRGINREITEAAVADFLSEIPEEEILAKAVEKCKKMGKSGNAAVRYLLAKGFSYSQIKQKVTTV